MRPGLYRSDRCRLAENVGRVRKVARCCRSGVSEESACKDACRRVLIPFTAQGPDIMSWDVLPLYKDESEWLESIPSCGTPPNPAWDEDPNACSHSVQVKGQCRLKLNGTVNFGTLGIMARRCHNRFPDEYVVALRMAEAATRGHKLVICKEDATLHVAWLNAKYRHGPSGRTNQSWQPATM
jgi:hypothetical protein